MLWYRHSPLVTSHYYPTPQLEGRRIWLLVSELSIYGRRFRGRSGLTEGPGGGKLSSRGCQEAERQQEPWRERERKVGRQDMPFQATPPETLLFQPGPRLTAEGSWELIDGLAH